MSDFEINDPKDFFELPEGFTAKDLKRAYTRKIKRYKPEKFPEEFKQIRAAYEQLESELAYGLTTSQKAEETSPAESQDEENFDEKIIFIPQKQTLAQNYSDFSEENCQKIFQELQGKTDRSTKETLLYLALLEQLSGKSAIVKELPGLLQEFPDDPLIAQFTAFFLKEDLEIDEIEVLLPKIAPVLKGFYYNAEALLQKILREKSRDDFLALLKTCEEKIPFEEKNDAPVFYSRIISRYFFRFPKEWILKQVEELNSNLEFNNDYLDEKLDFIDRLIEFAESLSHYLPEEKNIQDDLVDCIQIYCEYPGLESEIHFYTLMKKLRDPQYLTDNVRYQSSHISPAFKMLNSIAEEFKYARGLKVPEEDSILSIFNFLKSLNNGRYNRMPRLMSILTFGEKLAKLILFTLIAALISTPFFWAKNSLIPESDTDFRAVITLVGLLFSPFAAIFPYKKLWPWVDRHLTNWAIVISHRQYNQYLRQVLLSFIIDNIISEDEINNGLNTYTNTNVQCSYIQIGIPEDYAVSLAAMAAFHRD